MAIGPLQLIRQATPGQRRTLLAASMGWALDAFDAMLYSLVLAMLMRDLGMSKTTAGSLGTLTLLASGIACRPHRAEARAYGKHPDIFGLFVCLGASDQHWDAGGGSIRAWPGDGRGVEYRRDACCRVLADRVAGEGDFYRAELVGAGIRGGGFGGRSGVAFFWMAGGVFRGHFAGGDDVVDSVEGARVGDVAGPGRG
jgi:hypothetical protein